MISFYFVVIGVLGVISIDLLVMIFQLHRKLTRRDKALQHELQNLRHEFNTKLYPVEKALYEQQPGKEEIIYDGRNKIEASDFTGNGARAWDYVAHRFTDGVGDGSHQIKENVVTVYRSNRKGRNELYLRRFDFAGKHYESIL